ncbi:hypothetical protein [Streptosporangium roseum]|uniref:hypothetical protein n=1 Tax=Streptosporangium roseum TaxID=2001 RepID=UPI00331CAF69
MSDLAVATIHRIRKYATKLRLASLDPAEMGAAIIITLEEAEEIRAFFEQQPVPSVGFIDQKSVGMDDCSLGMLGATFEMVYGPPPLPEVREPGVLWATMYDINLIIVENVTEGREMVHPILDPGSLSALAVLIKSGVAPHAS